ncbi:FecR family protein [Flavivirga sp. 57AJ16]|uniref:FecR family protein n=1 Tax=Flavivirga sp. 57AJ16 TaxID=3025307 RepID=UPI0023672ADD|nr:FecR family protein [Flavivirga sp. 57AJ16]MDD7885089.1 DUF4974 domain-containing protein [Flavivirga sp. 57AJ16]
MEDHNYLNRLIKQLFKGSISNKGLKELSNFFISHQTSKTWPLDPALKAPIKADIYAKIQSKLQQEPKAPKVVPFYKKKPIKYAAVAAILLLATLTILLQTNTIPFGRQGVEGAQPIIVNNQIQTGSNKAILTQADGITVVLEKDFLYQTTYASSNGKQITYNTERRKASRLNPAQQSLYETLTIPRGGHFQITLSDGTKVWLNSETQLKYPVAFTYGQPREVSLIYGEAYFDVSPSTDHNGSPFKVFNSGQEVEVLGTEFNIKAYKDETNIYTTLVEGKVAVNTPKAQHTLVPNQQLGFNVLSQQTTVTTVDVYYHIAWKDGTFNFVSKPLKDIMQTLSRWYDMDVIFENKDLENVTFTGVLRKNQNIEAIMATIGSVSIETYEIRGKTIVLK